MKKIILALLILYLPFQLELPQLPVINIVNIFLVLLAAIFIFTKRAKVSMGGFDIPLAIFLVIWVASFLHTLFYVGGEVLAYEITVLFKRLISLVVIYFVFSRCIKTKKELNFLFYVFLVSIVLVAFHTWRNGMLAGPHFADFKRSSGPFGEGWKASDIAGGFLAIFTPFILSFVLLAKRKKTKIFGIGGLVICIMGILATYSRGSIMALGLASAITILIIAKKLLKSSKFSALMVLVLFLGLTLGWKMWVPKSIIHRAGETVQEENFSSESKLDESTQGRIDKWKLGLDIFKTNPLFGVGFKMPEFMLSTDTHNTFIQIAAEMGILGIMVFLWLLWKIFRLSTTLLHTEFNIIAVGFIGCLIAFIAVNMFYSNFFRDAVVGSFWVILGLLVAAKRFIVQDKKLERKKVSYE